MKKRDHKVIERSEQRAIKTRICDRKGCKFYGQPAQQGVCYSDDGDLVEFAKLDAHGRELRDELASLKKHEGRQYVRALEAYYVSAMMNWQLTLDECIRLRRDLAIERTKRGKARR